MIKISEWFSEFLLKFFYVWIFIKRWFNNKMRNPFEKANRKKIFLKPLIVTEKQFKSSDVNILLNRVKSNEKLELRKKLYTIFAGFILIISFGLIFLQ